eukprot:EST47532.1 Hypothetical protein SS50377_12516 [Spironucleus salmonicida]
MVLMRQFNTTWTQFTEPTAIAALAILYGFKGKVGIHGVNYYKNAEFLLKYGIASSQVFADGYQVTFYGAPDIPDAVDVVITKKPVQTACQVKVLCLSSTNFNNENVEFLIGKSRTALAEFRNLEIGIINGQQSLTNLIPKMINKQSTSYENSLAFKYKIQLNERARIKAFLDNDPLVQRYLSAQLNSQQYLTISAHIVANILKLLWLQSETELSGRSYLIKQILNSFFKFQITNILFVVPDITYQAIKNFLTKNIPQIQLNFTFENINISIPKSVILLSETQLLAYSLSNQRVNKQFLPQFVISPFVSTRDTFLLISQLYAINDVYSPKFIQIYADNTVESNYLRYKLYFPHIIMKEYSSLKQVYDANKIQTFDSAIQIIKLNGYNGDMRSNGFDWTSLDGIQPMENDIENDKITKLIINFYAQNEVILQASWGQLLNINKNLGASMLNKIIQDTESYNIDICQNEFLNIDVQSNLLYTMDDIHNTVKEQLTTPEIIFEQYNKLFSIQGTVPPNKLLQNFLQISRNFKPSETYVQEQKRVKSSKNYFIIPPIAPTSDNYQILNKFTRNNYNDKQVTLCSNCSEKAIFYGRNCDVCDVHMDQICEEINFPQGKNQWNLSNYFNKTDTIQSNADFLVIKNVNFVGHDGTMLQNQLIVKGKKIEFDDATLEKVSNLLKGHDQETQRQLFQAFISLIDSNRPGVLPGTCAQIQDKRQSMQIAVDVLIADFLIQNDAVFSQNLIQQLVQLPLSIIVEHAIPLVLCPYSDNIDQLISKQTYFQGNLVNQLLIILENSQSEIAKFTASYIQQHKISSYEQLSSVESMEKFYENLLQFYFRQAHYNFEPSNNLINFSTFNTNTMLHDNVLVNFLTTKRKKTNFLVNLKISQKRVMNCKFSPGQISAFIRYYFYQISIHHFIYHINSDHLNNVIASSTKTRDFQQLTQALSPGFSPSVFCLNNGLQPIDRLVPIFDPIPQNSSKIERKFVQNTIISPAKSQQHTPKISHSQKQQSAIQQVQITQQLHQQIPQITPPAAQIKIPQFNTLPIPLQIPIPSIAIQPQFPQIPQIKTEQAHQVKIMQQIQPAQALNTGQFFDNSLQQAQKRAPIQHIHRIIAHYSCRSYYYRQNLLYVPNIRVLASKDALSQQLGLIVTDVDNKNPNSDPDFDVLIQILTNDFQLQNVQKFSNVHKFCTVFNDEAKNRLETVSLKPQLPLKFYDQEKYLLLTQWLLKRTLQAECDLNRGNVIAFSEDPVFGTELHDFDAKPQESSKLRFAKYADVIYNMDQEQAQIAYNECFQICEKYDKEYRDRQMMFLVKIGIGTGSTPLETFYRFIQKDDPQKVSTILTNLVRLLTICAAKEMEFPYKVAGVSANLEQVQQSIYRLEHMRFLHIKLQQFDFLQWLHRLQKFKQNEMSEKEREFISSIVQKSLCCDIRNVYSANYKQDLSEMESRMIDWIGAVAAEIDNFNQVLWTVDLKFNQFLPGKDPIYNTLRHFKLEMFAINDFDQSLVKKAWEITLQFKLLFLQLFGDNKQLLLELLEAKKISQNDIRLIDSIFLQIQSMWSRLHDFILMHIITDMGYTEAMMQSIVGKDTRQKSKHVEFLRQGFFVDEESFSLNDNELYKIFINTRSQIDSTGNASFMMDYQNLFYYLKQNQRLTQPNKNQLLHSIQQLRKINVEELFTKNSISKELLTRRVERIAHALRCERILTCDPLQKYLNDKAVTLVPPQSIIPQILGVADIQFLVPPQTLPSNFSTPASNASSFNIKIPQGSIPQVAIPQIALPPPPKNMLPKTPVMSQVSPTMKIPPKTAFSKVLSAQQQPPQQQQQQQQQITKPAKKIANINHGQTPQPIEMPKSAIRFVTNTKLSFFMENNDEVREFVTDIVNECGAQQQLAESSDMDSFLFFLSSCQKQNAEDWGRLYSFLIKDEPQPLNVSNLHIKETYNILSTFALQKFGSQNAQDVMQKMQQYIYIDCRSDDQVHFDDVAQKFVEAQLNIAYFHAFGMRQAIVERQPDWQKYKVLIHGAFQAMQIMNQIPLNSLVQKDNNTNKRKMALSTYFFLSQNPE